jgi:hypothetical protein
MKRRISENDHRAKGISRMPKRSREHEKQIRALYLDLPPEALVVERVGVAFVDRLDSDPTSRECSARAQTGLFKRS